MNQIRVLIVEDDIFIAQDISEHLENLDYQVSGIAYNAADAISQLDNNLPELVLLDINLGEGKDGIDVAEHINTHFQLPFIFLTSYASKSILDRAKLTQPAGYIVKPFEEKDLYSTIEIALFNHAKAAQPPTWQFKNINELFANNFTKKEIELLQDIFEGKTNQQLCKKHFISLSTVKTHVSRIYQKLDVHSRSEAMATLRKSLEQVNK